MEVITKNSAKNKKRCLITDILFPTKYSKWRLVEIHSFINNYDTDIFIINKTNNFKNIVFSFDYLELKEKFNLYDYDILIFNSNFNHINKYNDNFDGTKFNNFIKGDYLFRKKKFRNEEFDINNYNFIYHIFLINYYNFNNILTYPFKKQFIHLYPGGGITSVNIILNLEKTIHKDVNLIPTQHFISKYLIRKNKINLFGAPFYYSDEKNKIKKSINKELSICFTCLGDPVLKGSQEYVAIAKKYKEKYENDSINFISIGSFNDDENINSLPPMDQDILDKYYYDNIDIVINLTTGKAIDGFPLGVESIICGCLLLTTDTFNVNENNNFYFNNFIIISKFDIDSIVQKIKLLYDDRHLLNNIREELQTKVFKLYSYDNMINNRFNFIENILKK